MVVCAIHDIYQSKFNLIQESKKVDSSERKKMEMDQEEKSLGKSESENTVSGNNTSKGDLKLMNYNTNEASAG